MYWSRGGYCLWAKRLEAGRFAKVAETGSMGSASANAVTMTDTQLMMWLDGIELDRVKQRKRFVLARDQRVHREQPIPRDSARHI